MTMKRDFWIALVFCAALHPSAQAQALPDNPVPTTNPDPMWTRVENLKPGTPIVVSDAYGPPAHCLFAGATAAYLDCNPSGNPPGTGFRFNRADVLSVELDRPGQNALQTPPAKHNYHPAWLASMIAGGCVVGFIAATSTDAGHAAEAGAIGALVTGTIGAPLAFLPHDQFVSPMRPQFGIRIPFRLRPAH
jgi:hypothetical protein